MNININNNKYGGLKMINGNILNWYNTCNLKFEDKIIILYLQLENNNKNSKVYKDTKEFLKLIER